MKWEAFECDECHQRYALEQAEGDEIEEPLCPACTGMYSTPIELKIFEPIK
ncbi:hypothetical protein NST99_07060 [Paenibacillus sp. FSL L8-0470]|uniref:hypothetical protein n=1 Tax=Paenibacillus sp. FSL L8-0470 TaxID=2954688 RepID=UPI0030F9001F